MRGRRRSWRSRKRRNLAGSDVELSIAPQWRPVKDVANAREEVEGEGGGGGGVG